MMRLHMPVVLLSALLLSCPKPAPDAPATPWGPAEAGIGENTAFYTSGEAQSGDSLSFCLDWGDGTTSGWTGFVRPGDTVAATRVWPEPGTYSIRAQARDAGGRESDWSGTFTFTARDTTNHQPETPALPTGPDSAWGYEPAEFRSCATDPDGEQIMFRFFGAGDTGVWAGPVNSGDTFVGRLCPTDSGPQPVRCEVRDTRGRMSNPGPACTLFVRPVMLPEWHADEAPGNYRSCPAVGDGPVIYAGDWSGVCAVNAGGTIRWKRAAACLGSIALGPDGTVLFCDGIEDPRHRGVRAVRPDGTDRWHYECRPLAVTPAVGEDGSVYFGCQDSCFCALDSAGNLKWQETLPGNDFSDPVIGPDRTICVRLRDSLVALDSLGAVKWTRGIGAYPYFGMAIGADGTVYCGESLTAIRPDGSVAWRRDTRSTAPPAIGPDGTIYQPSTDTLYAISKDGTIGWAFASGYGTALNTPAVAADGTIHVATSSAMGSAVLFVLNATGRELRRGALTRGTSPGGPVAIGANGTAYVSGDGPLCAFAGSSPLADSPWPKYQRDLSNSGRAGP